jgi:dinuclear metal center YbgI/SA1388 family protein
MTMVADIVAELEAFAPPGLAADWDNVGLLLGRRDRPVERLMTCLTVTPDVAAEAVGRGAGLIVSHHPVLFRAAKRLTGDSAEGRMLLDLARADVAVYSPHTAFDNCPGGINDHLAGLLGLSDVQPLRPRAFGSRQVKLVAFVPDGDLARVSDAVFAAGAGVIGAYSECSFRVAGTGTFKGSEESNPTVGQKGRREEASEWRVEYVCPEAKLPAVLDALRKAHSYETPAFDAVTLTTPPGAGEGRVGKLAAKTTLGELARLVRERLPCGAVGVVGEAGREVRTVALACGAAGEYLGDAARAGADVFLTGEARFHECLDAQARGIGMLLPGHHATERPGVELLARRLAGRFPDVEVWASEREADPVGWAG